MSGVTFHNWIDFERAFNLFYSLGYLYTGIIEDDQTYRLIVF